MSSNSFIETFKKIGNYLGANSKGAGKLAVFIMFCFSIYYSFISIVNSVILFNDTNLSEKYMIGNVNFIEDFKNKTFSDIILHDIILFMFSIMLFFTWKYYFVMFPNDEIK